MFTYKAAYKYVEDGWVHGEVLDFPGTITCGRGLDDARDMLASALIDMAETALLMGEPLPKPDPDVVPEEDAEMDLEEPIYLVLTAGSRLAVEARRAA